MMSIKNALGFRADNRHRLRVDASHLSVRLTGEEREDVGGDLAFLRLAQAGPVGPQAGEREQGPAFVGREPHRHLAPFDGVVLGERGERHQAAVLRAQPALPVGTVHVADVGGAGVGLQAQQLLEIDGLALGLELLSSLLCGIHQRPLRRRHAPARHRELAPARTRRNAGRHA
jgi:hypothetical protein